MGDTRIYDVSQSTPQLAALGLGGSANEPRAGVLDRICGLAAQLMQAPTVILARRDPKTRSIRVVGKTGTLLTEVDMSFVIPSLDSKRHPMIICDDVRRDARFLQHPILQLMPHIRSIVVMLVPGSDTASRAVLKVINPARSAINDGNLMSMLSGICQIISPLLSDHAEYGDNDGDADLHQNRATVPADGADAAAASRFLLQSLVRKHSLRFLGGASCMALRAWRAPIRKYQASALDALKNSAPPEFLREVAAEIAEYARSSHGERVIEFVAAPAVRSRRSGDAANEAVARLVAEALGARYVQPDGDGAAAGLAESCNRAGNGPLLLTAVESVPRARWQQSVAFWRKNFPQIYGVSWIG